MEVLLDRDHARASGIHKSAENDTSPSIAGEIWQGFKSGCTDELAYDRAHPIDTAVRGTLGVGAAAIATNESERALQSSGRTAAVGTMIGLTYFILSFGHQDDVFDRAKAHKLSEGLGYGAGRMATDLAITVAFGIGASRLNWSRQGERAIDSIIDKEAGVTAYKSAYVPDHPRLRMMSRTSGNYYTIEPIFRQERAQILANFLEERGQIKRFNGLAERLAAMRETPDSLDMIDITIKNRRSGSSLKYLYPGDRVPTFDLTAIKNAGKPSGS